MFRSKGVAKLIKKNKPINTAAKENNVYMLKTVAPNLNIGILSLRSGGASVQMSMIDVFRGMVGGKVFQAKTCISKTLWLRDCKFLKKIRIIKKIMLNKTLFSTFLW